MRPWSQLGSLLLGICLAAGGRLGAEEASQKALPLGQAKGATVTSVEASSSTPMAADEGTISGTPGRHHLLPKCMAKIHSWCCWSHHNRLGCGSANSDLTFIFGSCRTFFGEPCLPGPPPPLPGMPAPANARCNCP
jgi:hypothetical protein